MAAPLPAFCQASELPQSSPSRVEELGRRLQEQDSIIVEQQHQIETLLNEPRPIRASSDDLKDSERLILLARINDLTISNNALEIGLRLAVKDLQDKTKIQEDNSVILFQLINKIKNRSIAASEETVKLHLDGLYNHMKAIGRKQVTFNEAAKILKLTKSRVFQFKPMIALDERFIILDSESHKQMELIRLREYYRGNGAG